MARRGLQRRRRAKWAPRCRRLKADGGSVAADIAPTLIQLWVHGSLCCCRRGVCMLSTGAIAILSAHIRFSPLITFWDVNGGAVTSRPAPRRGAQRSSPPGGEGEKAKRQGRVPVSGVSARLLREFLSAVVWRSVLGLLLGDEFTRRRRRRQRRRRRPDAPRRGSSRASVTLRKYVLRRPSGTATGPWLRQEVRGFPALICMGGFAQRQERQ